MESQTNQVQPAHGCLFIRRSKPTSLEYSRIAMDAGEQELFELALSCFGHIIPLGRWMTLGQFAHAIEVHYEQPGDGRTAEITKTLYEIASRNSKGVH